MDGEGRGGVPWGAGSDGRAVEAVPAAWKVPGHAAGAGASRARGASRPRGHTPRLRRL